METQALHGQGHAATDDTAIADHVISDLSAGRNAGNGLPADLRDALIARIEERRSKSLEKHGLPLRAWNGRYSIGDALDEAIDLASYLRQGMIEWGASNGDAEIADALTSSYTAALRVAVDLVELDAPLIGYPSKPRA